MQFRYEGLTRFFKGQTHIHTTNSDGRFSVDDTVARYRDTGYQFMCITDHNVVTRMEERSTGSLCFIDSVELNDDRVPWRTRHMVCLGVGPTFPDRSAFPRMLAAARRGGALLYLAHPHWSGNSLAQVARGPFIGMEVFNGVTYYHNHKELGTYVWEEVLRTGRDFLGFAADDHHGGDNPGLPMHDLGWIMVAADRLDRPSILAAIRAGKFYSTTGPQFRSLAVAGDKLVVECTPAQHVWLLGPGYYYQRVNRTPDHLVERHEFVLPDLSDPKYRELSFLRLEIEDAQGHRAWTNKLFV